MSYCSNLINPGTYAISQQALGGMQFFDMYGHPHDQILATIIMEEAQVAPPTIPIDQMNFLPGYQEDIISGFVTKSDTIVFSMGANHNQAPFPQYYVNGKSFDPNHIDFTTVPNEAREYVLINAGHNAHAFHMHVN
jgi:suppressor of ftsI